MEFRFSRLADPATYDNEGLCASVPVRLHNHQELEERGIVRAQQDWREHVGSLDFYRCTMGKYTYMSCTLPECLPDRLEIISYANEISFMYDDLIDTGDSEEAEEENEKMIDAFEEAAETGTIAYKSSGKRILQSKILTEMLRIDRERALVAMKAWAEYLETSGRSHQVMFDRLDDFLEHRARDAGEKFVFAIITFGMGLTIPEEEHQVLHDMCIPCFAHLTLVNDLYSYEKELEAARAKGDSTWLNAINVLMREYSIGLDEAKVICRERIQRAADEFMVVIKNARGNNNLSLDLRRYLEVLQYGMSGNLAWSMTCPRYHKTAAYTERQIALMKAGREKLPTNPTRSAPMHKKVERSEDDTEMHPPSKRPRFVTPPASTSSLGASDRDGAAMTPLESTMTSENVPALRPTIVEGPISYIESLPGKNIRGKIIDALNVWFKLPRQTIQTLKSLVNSLHSASLMLDDIEDCSNLRRGMPAAHIVFGHAQTINSAGYGIYRALADVSSLRNPECVTAFIEEMGNAYVGQSYDLHWTANLICPTVPEYLSMIDDKTGGLFRLLARLMALESRSQTQPDITRLVTLVGRYFQIRDDYQNLNDADYTKQKGFCEDLDEGKYSFMLIHTLQAAKPDRITFLTNLLMQRRVTGSMTMEQKKLVLKEMKDAGSFEYTVNALRKMLAEIENEIVSVEQSTGLQNVELGLLVELLRM